ncbi:MAG: ribonuclease R [Gammaproteobacteria bacterium]|nr:ribonuclease R [Gammaproteobacteria bacterium]
MPKRRKVGQRRGRSRSASGYRHPVPEPRVIVQALESKGTPVGFEPLADLLRVTGEQPLKALRRRLQRMAANGQLLINRRGDYCLLGKIDGVTGVVSAHRDGFGFLIPEDGSTDVYLSYQEMRQLLNGDRVVARVSGTGRGGRPAGSIVEILERGKQTAVGAYQREHGIGYVVESGKSSQHYVVPDHHRGGAKPGQLVKLVITEYPSDRREAQGKILKVLGDPADPGMATELAIESFEIPTEWPAEVGAAAVSWGDRVRPSDKRQREDLRNLPLVTIDGADARDFDDAVYAEPADDEWRLIVAIADVSHYVRQGDALDQEAQRRGTSVYFADRVVPMLPESLSNGLCSLNPNVDRLCMVCDMLVTKQGKVTKARFYKGVMRSAARLTYQEVDQLQRGTPGSTKTKNFKLITQINNLYSVFRCFLNARRRRGALDLDLPEVRIELDDSGRVKGIAPRTRTDAHRLIEECMVAANVQAGKFIARHRMTNLYRVHAPPNEDDFEELRVLMQQLGIKVTDQACTDPRQMNKILQAIAPRPDYPVLAVAVLRSLSLAVYQPKNIGHFGLGLSTYAHFTSPIRRYPDLLVHRGIAHLISGGKPGAFGYDLQAMEQAGKSTSMLERRAEGAARYVEARYKCAFMLNRVGEVLPGKVTGVTHFGLFVTLDDLYVEGLIHVTSLGNDYFHCEHGGLRMTGERSGVSYGLGDEIMVRVLRVNMDEAKLDFALAGNRAEGKAYRRRRGS